MRNKTAVQRAATLMLTGWAAVVLFLYFRQSPALFRYVVSFTHEFGNFRLFHAYSVKAAGALGLAGWLIWVIHDSGAHLLRKLLPESEVSGLERTVFSVGLGLGIVSLATFGLGLLRLWYVSVFWGVFILATLAYLPARLRKLSWKYRFTSPIQVKDWWTYAAVALLICLGLVFLAGDLEPEIFYDSLHYHLAVPNLYLLNHRIYNEPNFAYASFVMTMQMVWGFALTLGNPITVKLLHGATGVLLLFTCIAFERRYLSRGAGLLGALFFLSMPLVGSIAKTAGIDVAWSALQFLAAFALTRGLADDHGEGTRRRWLRLAGLLTGLAASCKYTGIPAIPLAGMLILWKTQRRQKVWNISLKQTALFVMYATIVLAPYLIRNTVYHHNPVYPFAGTFWGEPRLTADEWKNITDETQPRKFSQEFSNWGSALHFALRPWFITVRAEFAESYIGAVLLCLLPLILLARPPGAAWAVLRPYALGLWLVWLFTTSTVRFSMPALALISLLASDALLRFCGRYRLRQVIVGLCLAAVALDVYITTVISTFTEGWLVLGGVISEDEYLKEQHPLYPAPDYEALDWMNNSLPTGSKVMMAGDARTYYARIPVVPSSVFNVSPIVNVARESQNGADMARLLRQQGVTHVFVNFAEARRTQSYGNFPWDDQSWAVLEDFWRDHVRLIWWKTGPDRNGNPRGLFVYQVRWEEQKTPQRVAGPPNPFQFWRPKTVNAAIVN